MSAAAGTLGERPHASLGFETGFALVSLWIVAGLYLDGWAHMHGKAETFFTPWHAVFYSGCAATAIYTNVAKYRWRAQGYPRGHRLPAGYKLTNLGLWIFLAGAIGDMFWHLAFGVESSIDALLSPTHLVLALSGMLVIGAPLRAALTRADRARTWPAALPKVISLTLLFSICTFFTMYISIFGWTGPAALRFTSHTEASQVIGLGGMIVTTILTMGFALFAAARTPLPAGAFTLMFTLNAAGMTLMRDIFLATGPWPLIVVALLGGVAADVLYARIDDTAGLRLFALAVPCVMAGLYFLAIALFGHGIWWSPHLVFGAIALAGTIGVLLSFTIDPAAGIFPAGDKAAARGLSR